MSAPGGQGTARGDLGAWMREQLARFEVALAEWVPADAPAGLGEAMRYGVLDGGKRLRPLLVLAAARSAAGRWPSVASHAASTSSGRSRLPPSSTP